MTPDRQPGTTDERQGSNQATKTRHNDRAIETARNIKPQMYGKERVALRPRNLGRGEAIV